MKPLVVIPARGGSKGIPRKNIKCLNEKPLIYYTLEEARKVFADKFICVTTDDQQIKEVVENVGLKVPFLRPAQLATDSAGTYEVLKHALQYYEQNRFNPDTIVLLQPTSPFRNAGHIKEALNCYHSKLDMVVSVKETQSNPYYVLFEEGKNGYLQKSKSGDYARRQDCPKVWELNGAIYIINPDALKQNKMNEFKKVHKYVMDQKSSHDIDTPLDWKVAETILKS